VLLPPFESGTTTPVAAGPQPMLARTVVVAVTVGVGSVVVPPVTFAQQEHAELNSPGEEQWAEAKVGTALGVRVSLPMRVTVVVKVAFRVVNAAEVEGEGTTMGSVVNLVRVLVTVLLCRGPAISVCTCMQCGDVCDADVAVLFWMSGYAGWYEDVQHRVVLGLSRVVIVGRRIGAHVVGGLIVVRRKELHMEMRDSMGTPIPGHEPVTWFAQLSPEQSAMAMLSSMLMPAKMEDLIVKKSNGVLA
jgi:hypothetical protein